MMTSKAENIECAAQEFARIASYAPFRFGGVWFVCRNDGEFVAYRTKKAARRNSPTVWQLTI